MHPHRRWHRSDRIAVSNIIGVILMLAITIAAGVILWGFSIHTGVAAPSVTFSIRAGTSDPVWGDPTDCLPWFPAWLNYNILVALHGTINPNDTYIYTNASGSGSPTYGINGNSQWGNWWNHGLANVSGGVKGSTLSTDECTNLMPPGRFSTMNSTQFIVSTFTPADINLDQVELLFLCNGTVFLNGTLASMTWFPGSSTQPAPNAPHLGKCGSFIPSGSYSTLYNRWGIFVPINPNATVLQNGDTLKMYVHTSSPFDPNTGDSNTQGAYHCGAAPDCDDYHGAPPWCFTTPGACALDMYYLGYPNTLLVHVDLYNIIRG